MLMNLMSPKARVNGLPVNEDGIILYTSVRFDTAYDATFNALGSRGGGMHFPFFIQSMPFGVSVSTPGSVAPRAKSCRHHSLLVSCDLF